MQPLTLAISPCPNDTFIFDAMLHHKVDTEGLEFKLVFADVEQLNQSAFKQMYDITKLSFHAYAYASDHYVLLRSGSALGNNCGPILISKKNPETIDILNNKIGIPGKYTTANLLFSLKYPQASQKEYLLFSEIENSLQIGNIDAGVIIHENRFTYLSNGLHKIVDLGEYWETSHQLPIPLGGISIKRTIDFELQKSVDRIIKRSIQFAFSNPTSSNEFIAKHAQEMSEAVCRQHIALYVNEYSVELGFNGEFAINSLFDIAIKHNIIPELTMPIFIDASNA